MQNATHLRLTALVLLSLLSIDDVSAQNVGFSSQVLPNRELAVPSTVSASTTTQARNGIDPLLPKRELTTVIPNAAKPGPELAQITGRTVGRFGILADGAFSAAVNSSSGAVPAVGALGLNFVVLQPVTYWNTYRYASDTRIGPLSTAVDSSLHRLPGDTQLQTEFSLNIYGAFGSRGDTLQINSKLGQIVNQTAFGQVLLQPGVYTRGFRSAGISMQVYPFHWWEKYYYLRRVGFTGESVMTATQWGNLQQRAELNIWLLAGGINYLVFDSPSASSDEVSGRMELFVKYSLRQISGDIRDKPII